VRPTDEQRRAIETRSDKALVVACPGSGKTEVIVLRVLWLLGQWDRAQDIAVITYTNAAAKVLVDRLADHGVEVGFVGTLHSFCMRHLSAFGPWRNLRVMDESDADALLSECARAVGAKASWDQLVAERDGPGSKAETPAAIAVAKYRAEMVSRGELDYDALLSWTLKLLCDPTQPRRQWAHLIVDEFQDAARIDAMIYGAAEADHRFYVGDPMQSIFAFRGSSVGEIEKLTGNPHWEKHRLTTNFRSLPAICDALNNLARAARHGAQWPVASFAEDGGYVHTRFFDDEAEEAEGIALAVGHMAAQDSAKGGDQVPQDFTGMTDAITEAASNYAVLARNNRIADGIADEMKRRGVPVCQLKKLEQPADWKLAMAALGVLAEPWSKAAWRRWFDKVDLTVPPAIEITGRADKMREELANLSASPESIDRIIARFGELPVTADLRDLELSLALDPVSRRMEGAGCFVGTIHAAKGQEWDRVVVAAFEDQVMPGGRRDADVAEERRLAYVAISRARVGVTLSWAGFRSRFGTPRLFPQDLSRFAEEAGAR
jgi:DNA helicase-2/ATP-dependent DNA helicase PcrA